MLIVALFLIVLSENTAMSNKTDLTYIFETEFVFFILEIPGLC